MVHLASQRQGFNGAQFCSVLPRVPTLLPCQAIAGVGNYLLTPENATSLALAFISRMNRRSRLAADGAAVWLEVGGQLCRLSLGLADARCALWWGAGGGGGWPGAKASRSGWADAVRTRDIAPARSTTDDRGFPGFGTARPCPRGFSDFLGPRPSATRDSRIARQRRSRSRSARRAVRSDAPGRTPRPRNTSRNSPAREGRRTTVPSGDHGNEGPIVRR